MKIMCRMYIRLTTKARTDWCNLALGKRDQWDKMDCPQFSNHQVCSM